MPEWYSARNLKLAWERVVTGQNVYYKNLQRLEIDAFAWAESANLELLASELRVGDFAPSRPSKFYMPKANGTTRPVTLLTIQDSIVYQALGNIVARIVGPVLRPLYGKVTFSNRLNMPPSIYFFGRWQEGYRMFQEAQKTAFTDGFHWLAEFDFASFYDIVGHRQLLDTLAGFGLHEDMLRDVQHCLETWTDEDPGVTRGHGVPQGPLTSALLAECFLHDMDKDMANLGDVRYFRYVDDIRILAQDEKPLERSLERLDLLSKRLGLVPQITKRKITKVTDTGELLAGDESVPPQGVSPLMLLVSYQRRLRKHFLSCFHRNGHLRDSPGTAATVRFVLFRMRPDRRLLSKVFHLIGRHPELSDPANAYLQRFGQHRAIGDFLFKVLETDPPYDWRTARCLETLIMATPKGEHGRLRKLCRHFKGPLYHPFLRSVAHLGLMPIARERQLMVNKVAGGSNFYFRRETLANLAEGLPQNEKAKTLTVGLSVDSDAVALCAAYLMRSEGMMPSPGTTRISTWASPILATDKIIPNPIRRDRIGEILKARYKTPTRDGFDFRSVLGSSYYRRALAHLLEAERSFKTQRSRYVCQMDNFNQILVKVLFRRYPGQKKKPWDQIWSSISHAGLTRDFPTFSQIAKLCHELRTSCPEPHPYSQTLGAFGREVTVGQRNRFEARLRSGYQEFVRRY